MVMPVNVAPNPQSERAQTTETPCSEPKTRFGEYPGFKEIRIFFRKSNIYYKN